MVAAVKPLLCLRLRESLCGSPFFPQYTVEIKTQPYLKADSPHSSAL